MIRRSLAVSVAAFAIIGMTACTTGVRPDANLSSQLIRGVSTEGDVTARLGQPFKEEMNSDGTKTVSYGYASANALLLVGIASGEKIITVVKFDRNGKYVSLTTTKSAA